MKKVKRRTYSIIIPIALILVGLVVYLVKLTLSGGQWVLFPSNQNVFHQGVLAVGTVYDRNGDILAAASDDGMTYSDSETVRRATLHVVGDPYNNIYTGALRQFSDQLIGYNLVNGTYSASGKGGSVTLTIDSALNVAALNALGSYKGCVAVYNYETGEILCNVSTPTYDPANVPEISDDDSQYDGVYLNRLFSSTFTPGSTFKLVTTAAAIETLSDADTRTYTCTGSTVVDGNTVTCTGNHGTVTLEDALAVSCNVYFAELSLDLGGDTLALYANQMGLLTAQDVDGITTKAGNFVSSADGSAQLAWSGIGQYEDLVNPCAMMTLMGAIANGGEPVAPHLLKSTGVSGALKSVTGTKTGDALLSSSTASALKSLMRNNVLSNYGESAFPGLQICAKSGTAEVGEGKADTAWFVGFLNDTENPLAFVVVVEEGGSGVRTAGAIANTVLQAAVSSD